jgi:hypothetical protein
MSKERVSFKLFVVCFILVLMACVVPSCKKADQKEEDRSDIEREKIIALQRIAGGKPSIVSEEVVLLQKEVAQTRRLDAAIALIESLSLSLPAPANVDEITASQTELIPSIMLLDNYFGKDVGPLLYAKALTTEHEWLRPRLALAARAILDKESREQLSSVFSLKESTNGHAKEFLELLSQPILTVQLPTSLPPHEQEVIRKMRENLKKKGIRVPERDG